MGGTFLEDVMIDNRYSADNARKLGWAGFGAYGLVPERVAVLDAHVVGPRVLDAGCGSGAFTDYFSRRGFETVGIDAHQFCINAAVEFGYQGTYLQADLTEPLPFGDGEFDTVVCCDVLEHLPNDNQTLCELVRVAKRRVVLTVPQDAGDLRNYRLVPATYQDVTHVRYYTRSMLDDLTRQHVGTWKIFGEQAIDVCALGRKHIVPKSRWPGLGRIYRNIFRFLSVRSDPSSVYMNWCVVLDKQNTHRL